MQKDNASSTKQKSLKLINITSHTNFSIPEVFAQVRFRHGWREIQACVKESGFLPEVVVAAAPEACFSLRGTLKNEMD